MLPDSSQKILSSLSLYIDLYNCWSEHIFLNMMPGALLKLNSLYGALWPGDSILSQPIDRRFQLGGGKVSGGEGVSNQSSWIGSVERWVGAALVWTISLPFLLHPPLTRSPTLLVTIPVRKQ